MNILKRGTKYKYTEKKSKDHKNITKATIQGPIEEVINTPRATGEVTEHETNKHLSNNFKKNYEKIKWDNKNDQLKSSKKELNKVTQIYKNN